MKLPVALLTQSGGPHLDAYFLALAASDDVAEVHLGDPAGATFEAAKQKLGDKLKSTGKDYTAVVKAAKADMDRPAMALVSLEASLAPPAIDIALERGLHVYAEKPACVKLADFEPLQVKAESKHLHLMFALANRTTPTSIKARDLIAGGELGQLYGVSLHYVADQARIRNEAIRKGWMFQKAKAGGGFMMWLGIHWLDLTMFLVGRSVTRIAGFTAVVGGQPIDVEDSFSAALLFEGGATGTMHGGYFTNGPKQNQIFIWGEHGWMRLVGEGAPSQLSWQSWRPEGDPTKREPQQFAAPDQPAGYTPNVHAAIRACLGQQPPAVTGRECVRVLKTIHACYEAAATGKAKDV